MTAAGLTTDRRILFFLTNLPGRRAPFRVSDGGRVDVGQTNSVLFDLSVWPSSAASQRTDDGFTTDRRILFFLTYLSGRRSCAVPSQLLRTADGFVGDGQTKSVLVLFDTVWLSSVVPSRQTAEVDDGQTNSVCVCVT